MKCGLKKSYLLNLFGNPLLKYLICKKNSLHVMAVLVYFPKLKTGLGLAFGAHFLHGFFIQYPLSNNMSVDKISVSYLFSFSRYQIKRGKFLLNN